MVAPGYAHACGEKVGERANRVNIADYRSRRRTAVPDFARRITIRKVSPFVHH